MIPQGKTCLINMSYLKSHVHKYILLCYKALFPQVSAVLPD